MRAQTRLIVIVLATFALAAWVALACDDCDTGARHFLRQFVRVLR
jgi:hypothetical protein